MVISREEFEDTRRQRAQLALDIEQALPDIEKRRASAIASVLYRNGVKTLEDIDNVDIADAIEWRNCGEVMCAEMKRLGAHGELPEKQPPKEKAVLKCSICGRDMEIGSRVSMSMSWEGAKPGKVVYSNSLTKTAKICRECAGDICDKYIPWLKVETVTNSGHEAM